MIQDSHEERHGGLQRDEADFSRPEFVEICERVHRSNYGRNAKTNFMAKGRAAE
jgi:hypothetical protein